VTTGKGLADIVASAFEPGGRYLYLANQGPGGPIAKLQVDANGHLSQPAAGDCISQGGAAGCGVTTAKGLAGGATDIALSPGGEHAYVTSLIGKSVAVLSRAAVGGALTQPAATPCLSTGVTTSACTVTNAKGLGSALGVVVSPDGNHVYVASGNGANAIAAFSRNKTSGVLTQLAAPNDCIAQDAVPGCGVMTAKGLTGVRALAMTSNGRFLYSAASQSPGAVAVFRRDPATGALSQLPAPDNCVSADAATGCAITNLRGNVNPSSIVLSPDERFVYAADSSNGAILALARTASGGLRQLAGTAGCVSATVPSCAPAVTEQSFDMTIAPDGGTIYTADSNGAVESYARLPSGGLAQLPLPSGCIADDESTFTACPKGAKGLQFGNSVAASPDNRFVFVSGLSDDSVAAFRRNLAPRCQGVSAATAHARPVTVTVTCADPNGDPFSFAAGRAPAGGSLGRVAASGTVTYTPRQGFFGTDSFALLASDGGASAGATVSVAVGSASPKVTISGKAVRLTSKGAARVKVRCPVGVNGGCRGKLTLKSAKKVALSPGKRRRRATLGSRSFAIPAGKTVNVSVKLSRSRRALVTRLRKLRVAATASSRDAAGTRASSKKSFTLRAAKPKRR
jgi:6-phosphogluconolactonase (cycloisomerase 2 family)